MSYRILIVDDEPAVRLSIERLLARKGYEIAAAASADAAYAILRDRPVDLILLDLRMPGVGGEAFYYAIIRQWPALTQRIVLMSGQSFDIQDDRPQALKNCAFLPKPFNIDFFYRLIEDRLAAVATREGRVQNGGR